MKKSSGKDSALQFSQFIGQTKAELEAIQSTQLSQPEQSLEGFSRDQSADNLEKE